MSSAARTKKTKQSTTRLTSKHELSEAVGIHVATISRWTRRPEWKFSRSGPWARSDVPKIQRWAAEFLEKKGPQRGTREETPETRTLRTDKLAAEVRKLRAQADQAETQRDRERQKLLDAAQVESEWTSIGNVVRNGFANLSSQLVPLALSHGMPQEAAAEFARQIDESVNGILRHLARRGAEIDEDSDEEILRESDAA